MEPLTSAVAPPPRLLGQVQAAGQGRCWRAWARRLLPLLLFLAVAGTFAGAVYGTRRSPRDLAFVLVAYYLLALLMCCVAKLEQLRRRDDPAAGGGGVVAERRRVRFGVWAVSVALATTFASRVADEMPGLALKLAVWGLTVAVLALAFYFLFGGKDAECCNVEHGPGGQGDAGHRREQAPYEPSPEGRVQ
ncbi:hypothetical protein BAE44_0021482 [Dichanthelium oligosanthes]|uniref:Uncharacterized protein n=1 Tax=Dichanthelium oligosanthes TaxID=888268 RepID=A0A1E5UX80_9POAL|nr:hypothetical protein BAE44_0021482 [Dichanthelium oligosanthes]